MSQACVPRTVLTESLSAPARAQEILLPFWLLMPVLSTDERAHEKNARQRASIDNVVIGATLRRPSKTNQLSLVLDSKP